MNESLIKRLIGAALGIATALLILFIGFWRTVLVVVLAAVGWWLFGSRKIPQELIDIFLRITHRN